MYSTGSNITKFYFREKFPPAPKKLSLAVTAAKVRVIISRDHITWSYNVIDDKLDSSLDSLCASARFARSISLLLIDVQ